MIFGLLHRGHVNIAIFVLSKSSIIHKVFSFAVNIMIVVVRHVLPVTVADKPYKCKVTCKVLVIVN